MSEQTNAPEVEEQELAPGQVLVEASTKADKVPNGDDLADEDGRVASSFIFNAGATTEEAVEMFGEDTVYDHYVRNATVKAQAAVRRELEAGTHPDDIPEQLAGWRPDVTHTATKDPKSNILSNYGKLTDEDKQAMLAQLQEQLGEG